MNALADSIAGGRYAQNSLMRRNADSLYSAARKQAWLAQIVGRVTGKQKSLTSLSDRMMRYILHNQVSLGLRTVYLDCIVGTESRGMDFDGRFNPRDDRLRERWINIASLRLNGVDLPAVVLLQVGDEFFVRDGHHRISVSRALGEAFIEAQVIRLELS